MRNNRNENKFIVFFSTGCPPRIPPSSDILVTIKIIKSEDGENESSNGRNIFEKNRKEVHKMMLVAENHFNAREFHEAIKIFRKWIDKLEKTPLKDEEEENKQKQILIKMYQNVSLCYNKTNMPEKTCLMIRDLERLTSIKSNVKALYAKGFANMMLYNFRLARKCFEDAERIMPDLRNISATIRELDKLESQKNKFRKEQNRVLMQMELEAQREMKKKTKKVEKERQQQKKLDEFETEIEELVIEFKNNQTIEKMTWTKDIELDSGWKIEVLEQLCQKHQLHLKGFKKIKSESTIYYMSKKSES